MPGFADAWVRRSPGSAVDGIADLAAAFRVPQLAQCFGFDLANAFARHMKVPADFLKRMRLAVGETESHLDDGFLARRQLMDKTLHLFAQQDRLHFLGWRRGILVLNEIAEDAVVFFPDRFVD